MTSVNYSLLDAAGSFVNETFFSQMSLHVFLNDSWSPSFFLSLFGILLLLYIISNYILFIGHAEIFQKKIIGTKRVLVVTAHPDDECMFFGPVITQLSSSASEVYLICLSDGGYEGLGNIRSQELWMSCRKLGLCNGNIRLYKHGLLQDNPKISWNLIVIGNIINQFIETLHIDTVITFDAYGVSGHCNHSAIYRAVMHLTIQKAVPDYCKIYVLESVDIFRKYSICIDLLISYVTSEYLYVTTPERRKMILKAMAQHTSQLLWYRQLYLVFSRYCYMNTIKCVS